MSQVDPREFTRLLRHVREGGDSAIDRLLPLVYRDLREQAVRFLGRERVGHTLQPTALVHEAYLRLVDLEKVDFTDRAHFYAMSATAMRRILVDHARRRNAQKRGGSRRRIPLDKVDALTAAAPHDPAELLALDEALVGLGRVDARAARIVELRLFGGLDTADAARALDTSPRTVERGWRFGRAWLHNRLTAGGGADGGAPGSDQPANGGAAAGDGS